MNCPRDRRPLERRSSDGATLFACPGCAGRAVNAALLRRMMPTERFHDLWAVVRAGATGEARCPSCGHAMRLVSLDHGAAAMRLDGCVPCQLLWFDAGELCALAPDAATPRPVLDAPVRLVPTPANQDQRENGSWRGLFLVLTERDFAPPSGPSYGPM